MDRVRKCSDPELLLVSVDVLTEFVISSTISSFSFDDSEFSDMTIASCLVVTTLRSSLGMYVFLCTAIFLIVYSIVY
jgi:hypothetical protein